MGRYDYEELLEKAMASNSTAQDRINLFDWLSLYSSSDWNGECFDIDEKKNLHLWPVYVGVGSPDEDGDFAEYELVDAEIR